MSWGNAVFGGGIVGQTLLGAEPALASDTALQLLAYLLAAALLERIGAGGEKEREREKKQQGFHLLILGISLFNASELL